jgi:hypothetical protein
MVTVPDWITDWIQKDRLVRNKFRISQSYLRHSKRIQLARSERDAESGLERFHYIVHSPRYLARTAVNLQSRLSRMNHTEMPL